MFVLAAGLDFPDSGSVCKNHTTERYDQIDA